MNLSREQLTDELVKKAKGHRSPLEVSSNSELKPMLDLMKRLNQIPKAVVPKANFDRVRNQILDRISLPKEEPIESNIGFLSFLPQILKIGSGVLGALLFVISGTIAISAAAIQSVPGQAIYPVKKVVENVQLKLASSEAEKANLQIKFANNRLEELEKVLQQSQQGKVSGATVQKLVENTVSNISKTTTSVAGKSSTSEQSQTTILTKLVDLSNKQTALLQSASIKSEGEVKIEIDKALETAKDSHDQTIENIEKAGLKIVDQPISITDKKTDQATASGKITQVSATTITIGTSKFLLTKDTKFVNIKQDELKVGVTVDIKGQVIQANTYALEISASAAPATPETKDVEPTSETPPPPAPVSK